MICFAIFYDLSAQRYFFCHKFDYKDTIFWRIHIKVLFLRNIIITTIIMAYKISDSCVACGTCIDECPVEAISAGDIYVIDAEKCIECGACAGVCPSEAISLE